MIGVHVAVTFVAFIAGIGFGWAFKAAAQEADLGGDFPPSDEDAAALKQFDDDSVLCRIEKTVDLILERTGTIMAGQVELDQAIADLKAANEAQQARVTAKLTDLQSAIDALNAKIAATPGAPDLSAEVADIQSVKASLDAEVAPASVPPAPTS